MNNSLKCLVEGMAETLRQEVIPKLEDEFARGQAFGVIYMLNTIALRAEWSVDFFAEQLAMQAEAIEELRAALNGVPGAPALPDIARGAVTRSAELEALRNRADRAFCDLIIWLAVHRDEISEASATAVRGILQSYMTRQNRQELRTSAKPMFAEMSRGSDEA